MLLYFRQVNAALCVTCRSKSQAETILPLSLYKTIVHNQQGFNIETDASNLSFT